MEIRNKSCQFLMGLFVSKGEPSGEGSATP